MQVSSIGCAQRCLCLDLPLPFARGSICGTCPAVQVVHKARGGSVTTMLACLPASPRHLFQCAHNSWQTPRSSRMVQASSTSVFLLTSSMASFQQPSYSMDSVRKCLYVCPPPSLPPSPTHPRTCQCGWVQCLEIQEPKQDIQQPTHSFRVAHVPPRNLERGCNRVF